MQLTSFKHLRGKAALWLLVGLAVLLVAGCQSFQRMRRPDADATLARPNDWVREAASAPAGTLFEIRHPIEPVRMRLRRLPSPVIAAAHQTWASIWLDEAFDSADITDASRSHLGDTPAEQIVAKVTDGGEHLRCELLIANAAGQTYVLETWGTPAGLAHTAETRAHVVASAQLPASARALAASSPADDMVTGDGWRLKLPDKLGGAVRARWRVDHHKANRVVVSLPSHLITAEILDEKLDYPIDAAKYATVALERAHLHVPSHKEVHAADDVRLARDAAPVDGVPMRVSYRFITRGERAIQLVVSTPAPLYEKNQSVIDALVQSLELVSADAAR